MIILANQVRQIKAKKVPIQKSRQLVIFFFGSFPVGGYGVELVLVAPFDYFEVIGEKVEVGCNFNGEMSCSVVFMIVFDNVFHASSSFSYRNFPLQRILTDS
jgi:hypothetical protein